MKIFKPIIDSMIDLFKKDVRKLRKISNEDIKDILSLKEELFVQVRQAEMSSQETKDSLFKKFKEFVARKFKPKPNQPQLNQIQIEQSVDDEARMLTDIFFKIISAVQQLGKDKSEENIAVVINKFFTITMDKLFLHFPEFTRAGPLQNLIQQVKQGQKGAVIMGYRFNLLSLAVFLGIEPLVVLFLFLGGDPSLTNQDNQDASYHLLFFQMTFRNIAMNVGWNPIDKDESKTEYKAYDPQFQSRTTSFEKLIRNIQSAQQLQGISPENQKILGEFMSYLRNQAQPQVQQPQLQQQEITQNSIQEIKREVQELKKMIQNQTQKKENQQFKQFKQSQPQQQPQNYYNFDKYLFNNNKLRRMLTFLSIFGQGIDLSRLVPQAEPAQLYVVGNVQSYPKMSKSSVLINMAKDKYLNEKVIIGIDSKYVKYSVYDLLRYFLIFNGFDSSNLNQKNVSVLNPVQNVSPSTLLLTQSSNQSLKVRNSTPSLMNILPFNFISNPNQTSDPFNYSFFFYLIANKGISANHKLELGCIALLQGSDPNIMPNFAQNLLSQIDPNLRLCDIFKMFLAGDYERIIRIFKMYSDEFKKGVWEDTLGEFMKTLQNQQEIIKYLQRERLSSQMSGDLRSRMYNNSSQYQENMNMFNESLTIPQQPQQEKNWFGRLGDRFRSIPYPFRKQQQQEVSPKGPVITTQPYDTQPYVDLSRYQPQSVMSGGSKIKLRTFHFLEPKSYNEHAFRAEKPIIAGKMAYDFLRTHYKLKKSSSIMFTIEDRQKDRKYNYIGQKVNNKIIIKST
jgi:DNA-binding ferritin-like protein (Dps family)